MDIMFTNNLIFGAVLVLWVLPWKGYSLWTAVKRAHKGWFVALLILNTFGILDIIYIFFVAKKSWQDISRDFQSFFRPKKSTTPSEKPPKE